MDNDKNPPQGENNKDADSWTDGPEVKPGVSSGVEAGVHTADAPSAEDLTKEPKDINATEQDWERDVINRLAFSAINEQRRSRRWSIFFKSLVFIYFAVLLFYIPSAIDMANIPR